MKLSQFLLFLAALTGAASNLVFKKHVFINTPMTWFVARDYCKQNYVDLSIIDTLDEFNRFTYQTGPNAGVRSWIGLSKKPGETKYTQWCDGTALSLTKWGFVNDINQNCVTTELNLWSDASCDWLKPFFCYSAVIVVEEMKTWVEASQHCRTHYTDLISTATLTDLPVGRNINLNVTMNSFWIGLRFLNDLWIWVNKRTLIPMPSCPNQPFFCGARNAGADTWENRDCREKMFFICYR